jgi:hypothetical protein
MVSCVESSDDFQIIAPAMPNNQTYLIDHP